MSDIPRIDQTAADADPVAQLAAMLIPPVVKRAVPTWRATLVLAGAGCGPEIPHPDDIVAAVAEQDIRFADPDAGRRAVELAISAQQQVRSRLRRGDALLDGTEPEGDDFASVLSDGLYGFADGLDLAGVDPDAMPSDAVVAFRRLGRLAAELAEKEHPASRRGADPVEREMVRVAIERDIAVLAAALTAARGSASEGSAPLRNS